MGIRPSWIPRWSFEVALLVLVPTLWSPYRGATLETISISRWQASYNVNLALGIVHRGLYPTYSPRFYDFMEQYPREYSDELMKEDLRRSFPREEWPDKVSSHPQYMAMDPGMSFFIAGLWKLTGTYTIGVIVGAFKAIHWLSGIALWILLRSLGIPVLALLTALAYLYSHAMVKAVYGFSYYLFPPVVALVASLLFFFALPRRNPAGRLSVRIVLSSLAGAMIGLGSLARITSLYAAVPISALFAISGFRCQRRRELVGLGCFLFFLVFVRSAGLSAIWTPEGLSANRQEGHLAWHAIWCGLGEVENPYGFAWEDRRAAAFVRGIDPVAPYGSDRYDQILRNHVVRTVFHHPVWFLGVLAHRARNVACFWLEFFPRGNRQLPWVSAVLFLIAVGGLCRPFQRGHPKTLWMLVVPFAADAAVPLLVYSRRYTYNLSLYIVLLIGLAYGWAGIVGWVARRRIPLR